MYNLASKHCQKQPWAVDVVYQALQAGPRHRPLFLDPLSLICPSGRTRAVLTHSICLCIEQKEWCIGDAAAKSSFHDGTAEKGRPAPMRDVYCGCLGGTGGKDSCTLICCIGKYTSQIYGNTHSLSST